RRRRWNLNSAYSFQIFDLRSRELEFVSTEVAVARSGASEENSCNSNSVGLRPNSSCFDDLRVRRSLQPYVTIQCRHLKPSLVSSFVLDLLAIPLRRVGFDDVE